ncbi:hypothetical protein [Azospirillum sp. TSO22-1]|uniref:hypothetical protein n=1 Tax=Azospirillum sp. TSO22-1 TaxID=716789 RepID=UPI000D61AE11|nr:hypothetical protein [Azospirillum sp. TSO22-1]PWC31534.1 hypothetical protein TSO221_33935 [Azospirillum sp. TSO22-1]
MPATYIADLPAAASLADGDAFPLDTGSATLKATLAQLRAALPTAELAAALAPLFAPASIAEEAVAPRPFGTAAYADIGQIPPSILAETAAADRTLAGIDGGKLLVCTAAIAVTLPGASDDGVDPGWAVWIKNRSAGAVSVHPAGTGTLDGGTAALTLAAGASCAVVRLDATGFESV